MALYPDTEIALSNISGSLSDLQSTSSGWYTGSDPGTTWHFGFENPSAGLSGQQEITVQWRSADETYDIEVVTLDVYENGSSVTTLESGYNVSTAETQTYTFDASLISDPNNVEIYGETSHTGGGGNTRQPFDLGFLEWNEQLDQYLAVSTNEPSSINTSDATLEGDLTYSGYNNTADVWFDYRETGASTWNSTTKQQFSSGTSFNELVGSLIENTEYEFRAQAEDTTAGVSDTGSTLTFYTKFNVSGTVTDANGNQIENATVHIVDTSSNTLLTSVSTDASGNYSTDVNGGVICHVAGQYNDGSTDYAGDSYPFVGDGGN